MKHLYTILFSCLSMICFGQIDKPDIGNMPLPSRDKMLEVGLHLEKAGEHHSASTIIMILGTGLSVMAYSISTLPDATGQVSTDMTVPLVILGSSAALSIGFKISGDMHEVKAGTILYDAYK